MLEIRFWVWKQNNVYLWPYEDHEMSGKDFQKYTSGLFHVFYKIRKPHPCQPKIFNRGWGGGGGGGGFLMWIFILDRRMRQIFWSFYVTTLIFIKEINGFTWCIGKNFPYGANQTCWFRYKLSFCSKFFKQNLKKATCGALSITTCKHYNYKLTQNDL